MTLRWVLLWMAGILCLSLVAPAQNEPVEKWDIFELAIPNVPVAANPFTDVRVTATFKKDGRSVEVEGFYDGDGTYRVRFMPDEIGLWSYITHSTEPPLGGRGGQFRCTEPTSGNHGPVRVHNTWHFAYADGTPYFQIGTTCYAWAHQGDELEEQTLETLAEAPFNKLRMCVFPKSYTYNKNEPQYYPYQGEPLKDWDFSRFNPAFFRHFEKRVGQLRDMGIEADIILFHPYDRWNFSNMDETDDDRYLRYVVARLGAYRNVWWSFANEFDLMKSKTTADWDRFFQIVRKHDPYQHLRGIHNCRAFYDHTKPWVTHASIQSSDLLRGRQWRDQYNKPILFDECKYEGNVPQGWGNITAQEMVHRFWLGTIQGCYVGHGETYKHPKDILWWSKGSVLHGQSPARIAYLAKIMKPAPFDEMTPSELPSGNLMLSKPGRSYYVYVTHPGKVSLSLAGSRPYKVDLIDTWNMKETSLGSAEPGSFSIDVPPTHMLLRLQVYGSDEPRRPEVQARADVREGVAPLTVTFSTETPLTYRWDFGDGTSSTKPNPTHVYSEPGLYTAMLMVTNEAGLTTSVPVTIAADRATNEPIVKVGFEEGDRPATSLHGDIGRADDGTYDLGGEAPWKWISVGDGPIDDLEGLRSFTILGWIKPTSLKIGSGGNRIAFNLKYNTAGFDLVHLADGRLRLAINEWPDPIRNDSSPGKIQVNRWTFFAVTYDATQASDNVRWYFGRPDSPAQLDRVTSYPAGPTGRGSGPLTIGNYNETLHGAGKDRQIRGQLRGLQIFGSRISTRGALPIDEIRKQQNQGKP